MVDAETPEWLVPFDQPVSVEWHTDGDEWLHHLMAALGEIVRLEGHSRAFRSPEEQMSLPPHYEITATSSPLTSSLRLVVLEKAILPVVTGMGIVDEQTQVKPWRQAIEIANARLGRAGEVFEWLAVVGPEPGHGLLDADAQLEAPARIGPLALKPAGTHYLEWVPQRMPSLFARSGFGSWPIIVSGETQGFDWYAAGSTASRQLRRLCGILCVAWGLPWTLRHAPQPRSYGDITIPPVAPWEPDQKPTVSEQPRLPPLEVPTWATQAWDLLESDPELDNAVATHLEGSLMTEQHPSFALIAFVGAIEAVGARLVQLEHCEVCGAQTGSGRRFRAALSLVAEGWWLKELTPFYTTRSKTAHAGELHGTELVFDFMAAPRAFAQDPGVDFAYRHVFRMQEASKDLLRLTLTDELPTDKADPS